MMIIRDESTQGDVEVRCFPSEDAEFANFVVSIVEDLVGSGDGADTVAIEDGRLIRSAERRLRQAYPRAAIHRRDMLAELGITTRELWYAFRDGTVS